MRVTPGRPASTEHERANAASAGQYLGVLTGFRQLRDSFVNCLGAQIIELLGLHWPAPNIRNNRRHQGTETTGPPTCATSRSKN